LERASKSAGPTFLPLGFDLDFFLVFSESFPFPFVSLNIPRGSKGGHPSFATANGTVKQA
jgi:hypothetical protein